MIIFKRIFTSLTASFLVFLLAAAPVQAQERDAKTVLKAMSDYVGSQQTIGFTFDSTIEVITPELEKIQFTNSGSVLLSRPDKFRAHRTGGYSDVFLAFDGKTVSVYGNHTNSYAQFNGPATIDQLVHALRDGQGIALPAVDLLLSNSYDILIADVIEAKYIGHGVIDGRECEHLAFRNHDTDWQLWVELGVRPVPRKLIITSKTMNSAPQYTVRIKDWKTDVRAAAADAFAFVPPAGAQKLQADELIELDELPQSATTGGGQ